MADFATLIRKRSPVKAKLTIFNNYLTSLRTRLQQAPLDELGSIDLEMRINSFETLLNEYDEIQTLIETDVAADPADQLKERETFETTFFNALSAAKQILKSYDASVVVAATPPSATRSASPVGSQISAATSYAQPQALGVKLPIIQLPKFDGNYEGWLEYRDTFESLIHSNDSINDIQKFHYLRASLNSGAREVIKALEFSSNNYQVAWDLLCARYDNKRLLINNHVKAIFNFEPILKESSVALRKLLDGVTKHLRALNTLGQPTDSWDTLIIHLIVTKLDSKTSREWEEKKGNEIPTLEVLNEFLKNRADLLETLDLNQLSIKPKQPHKERSTRSFVATKANCAHCKREHYIQNCNEFLKLCPAKRIETVKSLNLCSNCLRSGHVIKTCRFGPCRKCANKHNTLLHPEEPQGSNNNVSEVSNESITMTTTQNSIPNNKVLLATALVYVFDKNGRAQNARVLLDPGSQSSFVTADFAHKLNLTQKQVNTSINGINGGLQMRLICAR